MNLRRLTRHDTADLLHFYQSLSPASIRTFRPLGWQTSLAVCEKLAHENEQSPALRFDLLAWADSEIIGWTFIQDLLTDKPVFGLGVADAHQGQGWGKLLITTILTWARTQALPTVYLTVVQDNQRALHLYEQNGFVTYAAKVDENDQLPYFHMALKLPENRAEWG